MASSSGSVGLDIRCSIANALRMRCPVADETDAELGPRIKAAGKKQGEKVVVARGWASQAQLDRFGHTAHDATAGDAARHGVQRNKPPANLMSLAEASIFFCVVCSETGLDEGRCHRARR
jgi:hypothetical protein